MSIYYYDVPASTVPSPAPGQVSREERLRNGSLLDLSRIACEAGFRAPVAISREALSVCLADLPEVNSGGCSSSVAARRLWTILWAAAAEVMHRQEDKHVFFSACLDADDASAASAFEIHLKLVIDAGTNDRPVATILLPDQD